MTRIPLSNKIALPANQTNRNNRETTNFHFKIQSDTGGQSPNNALEKWIMLHGISIHCTGQRNSLREHGIRQLDQRIWYYPDTKNYKLILKNGKLETQNQHIERYCRTAFLNKSGDNCAPIAAVYNFPIKPASTIQLERLHTN